MTGCVIGAAVRHEYALTGQGTIGCLARRDEAAFLVSCDHVLRAPHLPDSSAWKLVSGRPARAVARWSGLSLVDPGSWVADLAAGELLPDCDTGDPGRLVLPRRGLTHLRGLRDPEGDLPVTIYGARTGFHTGRITEASSAVSLAHPIFGPRRFRLQFEIRLDSAGRRAPLPGDSVGPILDAAGVLIGFLSSEIRDCLQSSRGGCLAYGVPARAALERLGLRAWISTPANKGESHP